MATSEDEIKVLVALAKGNHSISIDWEVVCISQLDLDFFGLRPVKRSNMYGSNRT